MDNELLTQWLQGKYGPDVWVTKAGGIGWLGENAGLVEFINKYIFPQARD